MCLILVGCSLSGPTYGTDKVASLQFFEDVASIASLKAIKNESHLVIKPRPKLVIPEFGSGMVLPLPQKDVSAG